VAAWLDDDDQTALPALAKLAHEANRAAPVQLGRIATRPMGPWLAGLDRKERNALLRAPGGLSGTSWLKVAAEAGEPLAGLFVQSEHPLANTDMIKRLLNSGERSTASRLIRLHSMRVSDISPAEALWLDGGIPDDAAWPLISRILKTPFSGHFLPQLKPESYIHEGGLIDRLLAQGDPGTLWFFARPQDRWKEGGVLAPMDGWPPNNVAGGYETAGMIFSKAPADTRPLSVVRKICATHCHSSTACLAGAVAGGGSYVAMDALASPSETLISHADYLASPRALIDLRRITIAYGETPLGARATQSLKGSCIRVALGLN
jgi:hypothetical protein